MPDFTIEYFYYCDSVTEFKTKVGDYTVSHGPDKSNRFQYDFSCNCKGFKFRGYCKHIKQVKASGEYCGWNQLTDGGEPDTNHNEWEKICYLSGKVVGARIEPKCPCCHGPTSIMKVAL